MDHKQFYAAIEKLFSRHFKPSCSDCRLASQSSRPSCPCACAISIHPVSQYFWAVGSLAPCLPLHRFTIDLPPFSFLLLCLFSHFYLSFLPSLICMLCPADFPFSWLLLFLTDLFIPLLFFFLQHWPLAMPDAIPPISRASASFPPSVGMLMNVTHCPAQLPRLVHFHIKCCSAAKVQQRRRGNIFSQVLSVDIRAITGHYNRGREKVRPPQNRKSEKTDLQKRAISKYNL